MPRSLSEFSFNSMDQRGLRCRCRFGMRCGHSLRGSMPLVAASDELGHLPEQRTIVEPRLFRSSFHMLQLCSRKRPQPNENSHKCSTSDATQRDKELPPDGAGLNGQLIDCI
jgi:hypothetical protein